MKLGPLNSAIRELKCQPKIAFTNFGGVKLVDLEVTKQSLLVALKARFPEGRSIETGLAIDADGHICSEDELRSAPTLDDLLG